MTMEIQAAFKILYLRSLISMISKWVSFLAYPNLFVIKGFVVVVVYVWTKLQLTFHLCISACPYNSPFWLQPASSLTAYTQTLPSGTSTFLFISTTLIFLPIWICFVFVPFCSISVEELIYCTEV
jgi:hypothetical protein